MAEQTGQKASGSQPSELEQLKKRLADLELQLAQTRAATVLGTLPDHGAGIGQDVAETWSAYDQALAMAGNHPDQE